MFGRIKHIGPKMLITTIAVLHITEVKQRKQISQLIEDIALNLAECGISAKKVTSTEIVQCFAKIPAILLFQRGHHLCP